MPPEVVGIRRCLIPMSASLPIRTSVFGLHAWRGAPQTIPARLRATTLYPSRPPSFAAPRSENPRKARAAQPKKDRHPGERTVYQLKAGGLQPVSLKVGITGGRETELIEGLTEGEGVVVDVVEPKESKSIVARLLTGLKQ